MKIWVVFFYIFLSGFFCMGWQGDESSGREGEIVGMSYSNPNPENETEEASELKLYQAFIFSVPICFTLILLFMFYLFYLRRRSVDWSSLRMRSAPPDLHILDISRVELGLRKEVREMLPIIIFKESFSITDTQCAVCLGDYQADDKLQQIPACKHAFHIDCIDRWLSTHTTCPLCRLSLLTKASASKSPSPDNQEGDDSVLENTDGASSAQPGSQASEETHAQRLCESGIDLQSGTDSNEEHVSHGIVNEGSEVRNASKEREKDEENNTATSGTCRCTLA